MKFKVNIVQPVWDWGGLDDPPWIMVHHGTREQINGSFQSRAAATQAAIAAGHEILPRPQKREEASE